jgi:hypothetical protein
MKNNSVLYISPKSGMETLKRSLASMPGERKFITRGFVRNLTDEEFRALCELDADILTDNKGQTLIHSRMEQLGIKYDIDFKTKTLKSNGKD